MWLIFRKINDDNVKLDKDSERLNEEKIAYF